MADSEFDGFGRARVRPSLGFVANVLSQSKVVSDAFGKGAGFVLMMTGLLIVLAVSLATVFAVSKGAATVLSSLTKLWS